MYKGIVTFYLNRDSFANEEEQSNLIELIRKLNIDLIAKLDSAGYPSMFITTTGEASRAKKIEFYKGN